MNALDIINLRKTFSGGTEALKDISLSVGSGDFFALLGPNGAGKSTTIGIVSSLVKKTSGSVKVFGHDLERDQAAAKRCLGIVPQEFNFNLFEKVEDIVVNQAGYYGLPRDVATANAHKYIKKLGLWDKRHTPGRSLSGGMKRRLMIARALVHEPKLLILDEPTAGVDIELRRSMWTFLKEINAQGTTIILTTHYLEEAEQLCRNVAIIDQGNIIKNTSVKSLLASLNKEVFIFDLAEAVPADVNFKGFDCELTEDRVMEVSIEKGQALNSVFSQLNELGITVVSMRNKANRLEELFLSLVQRNLSGDGVAEGEQA